MILRLNGYADAKPSESIQPHDDPGIVSAAVFPVVPDGVEIDPPVLQYKGGPQKNKAHRARLLNEWLQERKSEGLRLAGFCTVGTQDEAATMGMSLIEELPDTSVAEHYEGFRLTFPGGHVDFAHAVALQHYWMTLHLAALRATTLMPVGPKELHVAMDRFPGADTAGTPPGTPLPPTDGARFLNFVEGRSLTAESLRNENASLELSVRFGTLDWWKPKDEEQFRAGKTSPYFAFPDFLAASTMASEFPDEFVQTFDNPAHGTAAVAELMALHSVFEEFDILTFGRAANYIRGESQTWVIPDDARQFIVDRATGD